MHKLARYIACIILIFSPLYAMGFSFGSSSGSSDLGSTGFMFSASKFFPTAGKDGEEPARGVENVDEVVKLRTPVIVILLATFATLMIILGGVMLVLASGKPDLAEKAKSIITTAILALIVGLCAYVIIAVLGNFFDI